MYYIIKHPSELYGGRSYQVGTKVGTWPTGITPSYNHIYFVFLCLPESFDGQFALIFLVIIYTEKDRRKKIK